jgi:uncharacterized membrane protein YeaQ/YmgE (transglycosylase-associated protein family)
MGLWGWFLLLAMSAVLATLAQYLFVRSNFRRRGIELDLIFSAVGALLGGYVAHTWWPGVGPSIDGLRVVPALLGALLVAAVVEAVYRLAVHPRQPAR